MNEPTEEQLAAIRAYAEAKGKDWKFRLNTAWWNGTDANEPNGHLLRQIRNTLGPKWLIKFKL